MRGFVIALLLLVFLEVVLSHRRTSSSSEEFIPKSKYREKSSSASRSHDQSSEEHLQKHRKKVYTKEKAKNPDEINAHAQAQDKALSKLSVSDENSWANPKVEDLSGPQAKYQDEQGSERRKVGAGTSTKQVNFGIFYLLNFN